MNLRITQLARTLLQKDSLESCSLEEVRRFADQHPYFGAAQLLLSKKMQLDGADGYEAQLQKTFLYFHNPLWVEQLLNEGGHAREEAPAGITDYATTTLEQPAGSVTLPASSPVTEGTSVAETAPPAAVTEPVADVPLFEPFHTVDYFASQGIRLREEDKPQDKFGRQLKSFTEWLKTMKRLPAAEIPRAIEPAAEQQVEELAEHSLEGKEVLTEAMAEVWEKQGNREKAIAIYRKLSLLEPAKSPYFAAKIDALK